MLFGEKCQRHIEGSDWKFGNWGSTNVLLVSARQFSPMWLHEKLLDTVKCKLAKIGSKSIKKDARFPHLPIPCDKARQLKLLSNSSDLFFGPFALCCRQVQAKRCCTVQDAADGAAAQCCRQAQAKRRGLPTGCVMSHEFQYQSRT